MNQPRGAIIMAFNPNEHLIKLQKKDYLEVKWRLVWFRETFPNGTIETEMIHLDLDRETQEEVTKWENGKPVKTLNKANGFVIFRATVKNGDGGIATGTKSEKAASFPDFIEKCESGAIGRALAALGFGTQFTGDELSEHHRIVDSPVERADAPTEAMVRELATFVGKVFSFKDENFDARWQAYKVHVLGKPKADPDLSMADIAKIRSYAETAQKEARTKASAGGGR
jgi:hypothetical protein